MKGETTRLWRSGERCRVDASPAPGEVGTDYKAVCPECGKRVGITLRCRYSPHKATLSSSETGKQREE